MPVKFYCKKCDKRFVDWGAEKLGFKCPVCPGEELVRVGHADERSLKRPSLKRKVRRAVPAVPAAEHEVLVPDVENINVEHEDETGLYLETHAGKPTVEDFGLEEVLPANNIAEAEDADVEVPDELPFGESPPPIEEEAIDEGLADDGDWSD